MFNFREESFEASDITEFVKPIMESIFQTALNVLENEELINRLIWAQAGIIKKQLGAYQSSGLTREEAFMIISNQAPFTSLISQFNKGVQK